MFIRSKKSGKRNGQKLNFNFFFSLFDTGEERYIKLHLAATTSIIHQVRISNLT
jgi:hypothetical protein